MGYIYELWTGLVAIKTGDGQRVGPVLLPDYFPSLVGEHMRLRRD